MANKQMSAELRKLMNKKVAQLENGIVKAFSYVGEQSVNHARSNVIQSDTPPQKPHFTNRTGNLASSIGYTIVKDGIANPSSFSPVSGKGDGAEGSEAGKSYADKKAQEGDNSGIRLIVVAGMPYAQYVQAKGYDVLDSAQLLAENEARQKINDVIKKFK